MRKIFCTLGLHNWEYKPYYYSPIFIIPEWQCVNCPKGK